VAGIEFEDVTKRYDDGFEAVKHMNLGIQDGEFMILVGPSGCGKSTALRMIAGLEDITDGELKIGDQVVNDKAPKDRDIAMVFQNYALYPHMTVEKNLGFALRQRKTPKVELEQRVHSMGELLGLEELMKRRPGQLSGGQRQRVAMGRALVREPKVFLLDEPLSNLDAALRQEMAREIRLLQRSGDITTIMVTHDQTEAMALADRLVVMHEGRVQQIGTPEQVHSSPANPFVARFIGGSNVVAGRQSDGRLAQDDGTAVFTLAKRYADERAATLAVRPDSVRLVPPGRGLIDGEVELCTWLGAVVEHAVRVAPNLTLVTRGPGLGPDATPRHTAGTRVALRWEAEDERLFDSAGRAMQAVCRETSHA
jgi:ABC-type sugar transport system ATPase subunit